MLTRFKIHKNISNTKPQVKSQAGVAQYRMRRAYSTSAPSIGGTIEQSSSHSRKLESSEDELQEKGEG